MADGVQAARFALQHRATPDNESVRSIDFDVGRLTHNHAYLQGLHASFEMRNRLDSVTSKSSPTFCP